VFPHLVNDNLEVSTSVSIDHFTGAAKGGALFTYETISSAAWLVVDLVQDGCRGTCELVTTRDGMATSQPIDVVIQRVIIARQLGIGGKGTRSFGHISIATPWKVKDAGQPRSATHAGDQGNDLGDGGVTAGEP
jgi:CRISPR-associated protein Cmr4